MTKNTDKESLKIKRFKKRLKDKKDKDKLNQAFSGKL
jgi:hypothetical protein